MATDEEEELKAEIRFLRKDIRSQVEAIFRKEEELTRDGLKRQERLRLLDIMQLDKQRLVACEQRLLGYEKELAAMKAASTARGAGGTGSGAAAGPNTDVAMTAFIRALRTAKLEPVGSSMSLLSLGPDVNFPDGTEEKRSTLLVRDFYANLLDHMKGGRAWLLTGVPGTGKSWWIWYAMFELLQEAEPPVIVWQSFKKGAGRVLFKDGMAYEGDSRSFAGELKLASTWYFVDGMLPEWVYARTVMVCSPKRSIYKDWLKGHSIQLAMPLWTWPEMKMLWQHLYQDKLTLPRAECNYNEWYGGVPRLVLEDPARRSDNAQDGNIALAAIRATSIEQAYRCIVGQYDAGSEASHHVIHQDGDRSTFHKSKHQFATSTVAKLFIKEVKSNSISAMVLSELAGPSNSLPNWRGQIFEVQAQKVLLDGGCFEYKFLDVPCDVPHSSRGPPSAAFTAAKQAAFEKAAAATAGRTAGAAAGQLWQLQLPSYGQPVLFPAGVGKDISDFCSAAKACSAPSYLQPAGPAHPVIDACIYPNKLLQFTVTANCNAIDEELLEQHLQCLPDQPEYFLDYCVPADKYDSFKVPDLWRKSDRVRKTLVRVVKVNCALRPVTRCVRQGCAASLQRVPVTVARKML